MELFQELTNSLILDNLNVIMNGLYKKAVFFRINTTFGGIKAKYENKITNLAGCKHRF